MRKLGDLIFLVVELCSSWLSDHCDDIYQQMVDKILKFIIYIGFLL